MLSFINKNELQIQQLKDKVKMTPEQETEFNSIVKKNPWNEPVLKETPLLNH